MATAADFEVIPQPQVFAPELPDLTPYINAAATRFKLDPALLRGLVKVESGGDTKAVSPAGALGAFQIMPQTAKILGYTPEDMHDPAKAAMAAGQYLSDSRDKFSQYTKDPNELNDMVIASYNAGPFAVERAVKRGGARWRMFVPRDRIAPTGKTYLEKVRDALGAQPATADDFEVVNTSDFEVPPPTGVPPREDTLNPNTESWWKTAWNTLSGAPILNPNTVYEGIKAAGTHLIEQVPEALSSLPNFRPQTEYAQTHPRTMRRANEAEALRARENARLVGTQISDPINYAIPGLIKGAGIVEKAIAPTGLVRVLRRNPVGTLGKSVERVPEPTLPAEAPSPIKRPYSVEPPIISAAPRETAPPASDFEVVGQERIPPTPELPTAAQVRPEYGPQRPLLFDASDRPLPRQPIAAPAPEPPAPEPLNVGILRDTKDIAERRTGGPIPARTTPPLRTAAEIHAPVEEPVELGPPNRVPRTKQYEEPVVINAPEEAPKSEPYSLGEGAKARVPVSGPEAPVAAEQRPELGPEKPNLVDEFNRPVKPETPTQRLIRRGGNISGGSGMPDYQDMGWTSPHGTVFSFKGKKNAAGHEYTHSEAIQDIHGQKDIGEGLRNGWVRWVRAGDYLNVETNKAGVDAAIQTITEHGRRSPGGIILEITDDDGRMIPLKGGDNGIFSRPWQAIEELKALKGEPTPAELQIPPKPKRSVRRQPPPISGGSGSSEDDILNNRQETPVLDE